MSLPKRTQIKIAITIAAAALALAVVFIGRPFLKTRNTCQTFQVFCDHIQQRNWPAAQAMVATSIEPRRFRIETGAVYYWDQNVTEEFAGAHPLFAQTFKYYLLNRRYGDQVMFSLHNSAQESGCVDLNKNKIIYVKIY
jgi:hypothetical protein